MMRTTTTKISLLILASSIVVEGHLGLSVWGNLFGLDSAAPGPTQAPGPGLLLSEQELTLGRRGFDCIRFAANVQSDPFDDLGLLQGPLARVLLTFYGADGLDRVCAMTHSGRALLEEASLQDQQDDLDQDSNSIIDDNSAKASDMQVTSSCDVSQTTSPADPINDPNGVYAAYAAKYLDSYLPNGDRSQRTDYDIVVKSIQNDLNYFRGVRTALSRCVGIWSGVNQAIGLIDVPIVDQDKISESIMSFSCGLSNSYNDIIISRNERQLERIAFHDHVITGAEIGATYTNTKAMMNNLCIVSAKLQTASTDIESVNPKRSANQTSA